MSDSMQAMVLQDVLKCDVVRHPIPEPSEGGMLLKVHACGLCGSDLRTIRSGHKNVSLPWILGHEICGEMVAAGPGYNGAWKIGDRIAVGPNVYDPTDPFCIEGRHELSANVREIAQQWPGGLAEYVAIPRESVEAGNLLPVPDGLPSIYAAIVEPGSSVIHAHEKAGTTIGDTVLVMGAGPIGCLHISVARARGAARVFVSDIVDDRLRQAQVFERDAVINSSTEDLPTRIRELTGGLGPSVVITANPAAVSQVQAVEIAAKGGRVVLFGGLPHSDSKPGVDMNIVHYMNLTLIGLSRFAPRHFRLSLNMLESGQIPGEKLVTDVMPLSRFNDGLQLALEGRALKVVFEPGA
jgi:L-iditol 2-dehydrogenase